MAEQARLQRKWDAEQKLRPGAAPHVPGAGKAKPKAKAGAKAVTTADSKLAAENKRLVARFAAADRKLAAGATGKAPPQADAPKAATNKAVKECEERLRHAKSWLELYHGEQLYLNLVAKH